jgi:hypothetical protein
LVPAITESIGGALGTVDKTLGRGANNPAGYCGRGIGHPGHRLTHV